MTYPERCEGQPRPSSMGGAEPPSGVAFGATRRKTRLSLLGPDHDASRPPRAAILVPALGDALPPGRSPCPDEATSAPSASTLARARPRAAVRALRSTARRGARGAVLARREELEAGAVRPRVVHLLASLSVPTLGAPAAFPELVRPALLATCAAGAKLAEDARPSGRAVSAAARDGARLCFWRRSARPSRPPPPRRRGVVHDHAPRRGARPGRRPHPRRRASRRRRPRRLRRRRRRRPRRARRARLVGHLLEPARVVDRRVPVRQREPAEASTTPPLAQALGRQRHTDRPSRTRRGHGCR